MGELLVRWLRLEVHLVLRLVWRIVWLVVWLVVPVLLVPVLLVLLPVLLVLLRRRLVVHFLLVVPLLLLPFLLVVPLLPPSCPGREHPGVIERLVKRHRTSLSTRVVVVAEVRVSGLNVCLEPLQDLVRIPCAAPEGGGRPGGWSGRGREGATRGKGPSRCWPERFCVSSVYPILARARQPHFT